MWHSFASNSTFSFIWVSVCAFALLQMSVCRVISQLSNDWDPDPDVRESCRAVKPARGATMLPVRCRVSVVLMYWHILNLLSLILVVLNKVVLSKQESFQHTHYFILLRQVWVRSQWRLPVGGGTLLDRDGHQHRNAGLVWQLAVGLFYMLYN